MSKLTDNMTEEAAVLAVSEGGKVAINYIHELAEFMGDHDQNIWGVLMYLDEAGIYGNRITTLK